MMMMTLQFTRGRGLIRPIACRRDPGTDLMASKYTRSTILPPHPSHHNSLHPLALYLTFVQIFCGHSLALQTTSKILSSPTSLLMG